MDEWIKTNQHAWNQRAKLHFTDSSFYPIELVRSGGSSLHDLEKSLAGSVNGIRLLHLQCHFGLDTISWARLGAKVTGIDISDWAISRARSLAEEFGVDAKFEIMSVQDMNYSNSFDLVVSTYGCLPWIKDLRNWAKGIAHALTAGGRLVLVEFHPFIEILYPGKFSGSGKYFSSKTPIISKSKGSYTDPGALIEYEECRWQHTLSDVLSALLSAGLNLEIVSEHKQSPYRIIPDSECISSGWHDSKNGCPMLFSLVARK